MKEVRVASFRDLMAGYDYAEIVCRYKKTVVRKLTVNGDMVNMDAITEAVEVPLDTPVEYEPWFMDRGSMLFRAEGHDVPLKLCTEADEVRYPDGSEGWVNPASALTAAEYAAM